MNEERIDVADSEIARRHALPARATVAADAEPGDRLRAAICRRRGAVKLAWVVGGNQYPVRVGIDVVQRRPGLAAVRAAQEAADFHGDMNDVGIFGMESDAFCMRLVGRAGKSPLLNARHLAQSGQLRPALA